MPSHTSEATSSIPHSSDQTSTCGSSTTKRKRGPSKLYQVPKGTRMPVTLYGEGNTMQFVGETTQKFKTNFGILIKDPFYLPYDVTRFADIPDSDWDKIFGHIQSDWDIDMTIKDNQNIIKKYAKPIWNNKRSSLYRHFYLPHIDIEINHSHGDREARNNPPQLFHSQWRFLYDLFRSDDWKKKSTRNTKNQKEQKVNHIIGRKCTQEILYEKIM